MEQFEQFSLNKAAAIQRLEAMSDILGQIGEIGLDVAGDLAKVSSAIETVQSDVLRIALFGAFSDGKTSVIAAWLGRIMDDMKIDMDESSDQLAIYRPEGLPSPCEIVDMPGLFGDKERTIDGKQVMYEDITKRYVSEAHLIFYVVDATNPLKESHSTVARWILRDLNKLDSTIFVINKMDEVVDLTEGTLFAEQAAIKRENLKGKLLRAANLSEDELQRLNIICIAANPNGRGLPFWFDKPVQYDARSRMNDLKVATQQVLHTNVPEVLRAKTGIDVVQDIAGRKLAIAQAQLTDLANYEAQNHEERARISQDIERGRAEVKQMAASLFQDLDNLERKLIGGLRALSLEEIGPYLEDEIGYSQDGIGYKLQLRIKSIIDVYFAQSSIVAQQISRDITLQLDASAGFLSAVSNKAIGATGEFLKDVSSLDPSVIKESIFFARDMLGKVGVAIKFKPWEAHNLAGGISKWAGPAATALQVGVDLYQTYQAKELERELQKKKDDLGELIKAAFKEIYDLLADDAKIENFLAPQLKEFEAVLAKMREGAEWIRSNQVKVTQIQQQLSLLSAPDAPLKQVT
jgi:GTPase SAR1 family protein